MVLTQSNMLSLGTRAPRFDLRDVTSDRKISLESLAAQRVLVVMFICNHCPYVKHVSAGLAEFGRDYEARDVAIVAINANDPTTHPDDAPDKMALEAQSAGYRFPYLFDDTQSVAKSYTAACTPDFFVFDSARRLVYRGQFDSSRPGNAVAVTGADLRAAVEALLAGAPVSSDQRASIGCNIKWRSGNEPEYFKPH